MTQTAMALSVGLQNNLVPIYNDYKTKKSGLFRQTHKSSIFIGRYREFANKQMDISKINWTDINYAEGIVCDPRLNNLTALHPHQNLRMTKFFLCNDYIVTYRDLLLYEFTFHDRIINAVTRFFATHQSRINMDTVLVGIHVRMGDYMRPSYFAKGVVTFEGLRATIC